MLGGSFHFPPPNNDTDWETVCCRVMARELKVRSFQRFRRRGQRQYGIDLIGTNAAGEVVVVQCKVRNTGTDLSREDAQADVNAAKHLIDDETGRRVPVHRFVIASTHPHNDHVAWAKTVSHDYAAAGQFTVDVYAWCDIQTILNNHPDLGEWYLGVMQRRTAPNTVPTPSRTFIPRKNITKIIHDALAADPEKVVLRQAVTRAMGGYGKTVAAILYADQYKDDYPGGRFFLSMESTDIVTALASLTHPLGVPDQNNPALNAAAVSQALRTGKPSLLILDNIASKADWDTIVATKITGTSQSLVPRGNCRVLITTRDDAIDPSNAIAIGRLTPQEAREVYALFCSDRRTPPSDETADAITDWLGGLAVAVAAVAAYMKLMPHIAWDDYWHGDGKQLRGLQQTPVSELPDVKPDVAAELGIEGAALDAHRRTLRVIDDAFNALPPADRRAVEYAALLPHDMAPAPWLEALLEADAARPATNADGTANAMHLTLTPDPDDTRSPGQQALEHLHALDILLPVDVDGVVCSLHRLWWLRQSELAKAGTEQVRQREDAVVELASDRAVVLCHPPSMLDSESRDFVAPWLRHEHRWEVVILSSLATSLATKGMSSELVANLLAHTGSMLARLGKLNDAYRLQAAAIKIVEALPGTHQKALSSLLAESAATLRSLGQPQSALKVMGKALGITKVAVGTQDIGYGIALNNYGRLLFEVGRAREAKPILANALNTIISVVGSVHFEVATCLNNMGIVALDLNELPQAAEFHSQSLMIRRRLFGSVHPDVAQSLHNISTVLFRMRDWQGALATSQEASSVSQSLFGKRHPNSLMCLAQIAMCLFHLQGPAEAEKLEREILALRVEVFGPDNVNVTQSYSNLAFVLIRQGRISEAVPLLQKAYSLRLAALGADHADTISVLAELKKLNVQPGVV